MNNIQKRVAKAKVEGIENAFIYTSGRLDGEGRLDVAVTLAYVDDVIGVAADWEPKYGPISVWHRCDAGDEGAKPHYIFDYVNDDGLNWSQMAVERADLRGAYAAGNFEYIFGELEAWAHR